MASKPAHLAKSLRQTYQNMTGVDRQIFQLNKVASAPGCYKFPEDVTALKLRFKDSGNRSQTKLFWTHSLPTMQFWNPSVAMSVSRVKAPKEKSVSPTVTIVRKGQDGKETEEVVSIASMLWENMADNIAQAAGATVVSPGEIKKHTIPFVTDYAKKMETAKKIHQRDVAFAQKVELHQQQEAEREAEELAAKKELRDAARKKKEAVTLARKEGRVYVEGEELLVKATEEVEVKKTEDGTVVVEVETEVKAEVKAETKTETKE